MSAPKYHCRLVLSQENEQFADARAQLFELIISWGLGLRLGKTWFLERLKSGIGWNASEGTVSPCRAGTVATCLCGSKRRWPTAWRPDVEKSELNGAAITSVRQPLR
jgi:hypothetical protein